MSAPTSGGAFWPGAVPEPAPVDPPAGAATAGSVRVPSAYGATPAGTPAPVASPDAVAFPDTAAFPDAVALPTRTGYPAAPAQPTGAAYPSGTPYPAASPYPGAAPVPSAPPLPAAPAAVVRAAAAPGSAVAGSGAPELAAILHAAIAADASDVHLVAGMPPMARIDGRLRVLDGHAPIADAELRGLLFAIVTDAQRAQFVASHELDFAHQLDTGDAFRTNFYLQTGAIAAAFRLIPERIRPLEELGVPSAVGGFASLPRGLVLVTGPTGSGKSTTLAAILDQANSSRDDHILTVEDPIEFRHRSRRCLVTQREVGSDTESFGTALRQALRQDPDIILVGELRDLETIQVALTAAETGHLVLGTLHTQDSGQTVDRIVDAFPTGAQEQVRTQLAATLQGIVSQTLCPRVDGVGRAVATEVLVTTPAVRALIRDNRTHQLYSTLHGGREHGMCTLDQSLAALAQRGEISFEVGLAKSTNPEEFSRMCGRTGQQQRGVGAARQEW